MSGITVASLSTLEARRLSVTGTVQGVGFRPFVHRLALRYGLTGWIRNTSGAVEILVEGSAAILDEFSLALEREGPPLCRIQEVTTAEATPVGLSDFRIIASDVRPNERQPVAPDVSLCVECEEELYQPGNRRYRFPFITCTNCGPRITLIDDVPYDRSRTSMRVFPQCAECRHEYHTPSHRRFHCETNCCPSCGPTLVWDDPQRGQVTGNGPALAAAARALDRGAIVALRGLGGFHLAVDATDDDAVKRLRYRKRRDAKPFAVMVRSLRGAERLAHLTEAETTLLQSPPRPIVVVERATQTLAESVAPGLTSVGLMLSYTPLHHLLLDLVDRPLVMTSGNVSDEPIAAGNDEARHRLEHIADGFLLHDRDIVNRHDDSVARCSVDGATILLRRARGFSPRPLRLPVRTPEPLVAVGPHLKSTFTLAHDSQAFVSQHLGDLENLSTLNHFQSTLARYRRLFRIQPTVVVRDLHPGYLSTRLAQEMGLVVMGVQHHHAHVVAVMAEHELEEPVIGVAYDGTGHGDDGTVWGGEILVSDLAGYRRVGHLRPIPLPGGDAAIRAPWRTALGYRWLSQLLDHHAFSRSASAADAIELDVVEQQLRRGLNAPLASSMGRLFDAVASVLGIRQTVLYEGQAAMELEALAGSLEADALPYDIRDVDGRWQLDPIPILLALGDRLASGQSPSQLAASFHQTVIEATAEIVSRVRDTTGIDRVVLSGGSFQNARLHSGLRQQLEAIGLSAYVPVELSPNDGAVSFGQAVIAATRLRGE